ncbi:MAG: hypothetical protein KAJ29_04050 [Alphaproteobacteria bacterium]|nr:hypothetical protein [Alphaproteobacteria bacterium]
MINGEISQKKHIETMEDNKQVIIVKNQNPDSPQDVRLCVEEYINHHSRVDKSDKDGELFIDPDAIYLKDGPDDSVFIFASEDIDAQGIVNGLEEEYLGKFSCEITNTAELKEIMTAMLLDRSLKDEPPQPDEPQP